MTGVMTLTRSSIGKKAIMAVTGFVWIGFVVFHMYGNLKVYLGPAEFNAYASGLREIGHPIFPKEQLLWLARILLILSVGLHIWAASALTTQSRESTLAKGVMPGQPYGKRKMLQATFASRTMRWGGLAIFFFILFHLANLTFGWVGYGAGQFMHPHNGEYQVYNNFIYTFQNPIISLIYILAMVALGLHLYHGTWSMFQTLGLNSARWNNFWRGLALVIAVVVVIGNLSFPITVLAGILRPVV